VQARLHRASFLRSRRDGPGPGPRVSPGPRVPRTGPAYPVVTVASRPIGGRSPAGSLASPRRQGAA
jgi:hypothetical protein